MKKLLSLPKNNIVAVILVMLYGLAILKNIWAGGSIALATEREGSNFAKKIVFSDGLTKYQYPLADLALMRDREVEETAPEDTVRCMDPAYLSYQLHILAKKVNIPSQDAKLYLDEQGRLQVKPEQEGRELDLSLLITKLANPGLYQEVYELPFKKIVPKVTSQYIKERLPVNLWSEFTTTLVNNPDRTENVRVASKQLDGLIIAPGQEVSFNEVVGPRIKERGYREAKVIVGGRFEPGLGGGVCQVSSTLYNTLLLAGLEIKERHNHSVRIAYVPLGRDATVVYGLKDLKFINNTDSFLLIRTRLVGLELTISLYGAKQPFTGVEMETKVIKTVPYKEVYVDGDLQPGQERKVIEKGQHGYLVETYRILTYDQEKKRELISKDYYAPMNMLVAVRNAP
ncbi:MAG: VanW like protein [Peptococcaceae bacterium]|nr:VanW like protein [Peptococcaceae bacterium]